MKVKKIADNCIKNFICASRKYKLKKYSKEICKLHKEWMELSKDELKLVKEDKYSYRIFKNVFGEDLRYFVSDVLYQNKILPKLNFANYSKDGRYCAGHNYFADKNYQEFL